MCDPSQERLRLVSSTQDCTMELQTKCFKVFYEIDIVNKKNCMSLGGNSNLC